MSRLAAARAYLHMNGVRAAAQRARYELALRTGWERTRRPATTWEDAEQRIAAVLPRATPQEFLHEHLPDARPPLPSTGAAAAARRIVRAEGLVLPQHGERLVPWNDVFTDHGRAPHWTQVQEFARADDIRTTWEPARLGWVWLLARASAEDAAFGGRAWADARRWMAANPPMRGPHWHSGQEVAVRLMTLTWAFVAAADHLPDDAPRQLALWASVIGERVAGRLEYAVSQNNNHSVTEAAGLLYAAALVPSHSQSAAWRRRATATLARDIRRQVLADGSYVQESVVYHRIALEALLGIVWLGQSGATDLEDAVRLARPAAGQLLRHFEALTDRTTGTLSRLGANDGSWLLFPAEHTFWDAAPTVEFARRMQVEPAPPPTGPVYAWTADRAGSHTVFKAGRPGARPTEPDALHVEHRIAGHVLLRDPGSFRYIGPAGLDAWFRSAQAHNTVVVDGREPIRRLVRFLWDRPQSTRFTRVATEDLAALATAEHDGLGAAGDVTVRRTVCRSGSALLVVDQVRSDRPTDVMISWHIDPAWHVGESTATSSLIHHDDGTAVRMQWLGSAGPAVVSYEWSLGSAWYTACALGPALRLESRAASQTMVTVFASPSENWTCRAEGSAVRVTGPTVSCYATDASVEVT